MELAVDVVLRPRRNVVGAGSDELLAATDTAQAQLPHEAFDRAPGDGDAFPAQQPPDLAGAADAAAEFAVPEHPLDLDHELRIPNRSL